MAQNSPGPGLRAINGPEFVSRGGKSAVAGLMSVLPKQVLQAELIVCARYLSILHLPASEKTTKRSITELTARNLHASGLRPQKLECLVQNRGFNRGPGPRAAAPSLLGRRFPS